MGYISDHEQQQILTLYGRQAQYRCDAPFCRLPIWITELPVMDKKGGFIIPRKRKDCPNFICKREPRVTYHIACDRVMMKKRPLYTDENMAINTYDKGRRKGIPIPVLKVSGSFKTARAKILAAIERRPRKEYWNRRKIYRTLFKDTSRSKRKPIRDVIQSLLAEGLLERKGRFLYLGQKPKK